ncbi:NUDIX hydrolase [Hyphomicrobium sulfonivorans]|uniref:NUDIX hydrolase n=1 Tax=Hyphomicrobium sulfonivorans TaxID=121290 RepID=UPI00157136F4|nr:NUDIX domain-containing protein [Hyphomicrobium sulfonivorans]MBI1649713.1 NUDIX domain-containing protein [Hyphomicrobium sulfonivorans]NSL71628.1 DNA mismatch repair protein MutT [Hyphomicrobium sulfonivorans]
MTIWRPPAQIRIRVKALGLHWRDGRLLAAEVYDDSGRIKGVRPLGGSVEFGETARTAVVREFREELGIEATISGDPFFLENIYVHEGAPGHELVILFNVEFPAGAFAELTHIPFAEDNGATSIARWFNLDELDLADGPALYPTGLKARLQQA